MIPCFAVPLVAHSPAVVLPLLFPGPDAVEAVVGEYDVAVNTHVFVAADERAVDTAGCKVLVVAATPGLHDGPVPTKQDSVKLFHDAVEYSAAHKAAASIAVGAVGSEAIVAGFVAVVVGLAAQPL